jgi:dTDP-4-amino-4,6-dideoxygalactose transaminase
VHYNQLFQGSGVPTPQAMPWARHVYHIYAVRSPDRARWQASLEAQGIQTGIHYPFPIHLLPAHADLGYTAGAFPHAEKAALEVLSLPIYPELTAAQREAVVAAAVPLAVA